MINLVDFLTFNFGTFSGIPSVILVLNRRNISEICIISLTQQHLSQQIILQILYSDAILDAEACIYIYIYMYIYIYIYIYMCVCN